MESDSTAVIKRVKGNETKPDTLNAHQMLEDLRKEMKQMFLASMEVKPHPPEQKLSAKGCKRCKGEGIGENCWHCFKCGQEGHFSQGCRAMSGNGQGLLGWGQQ